MGQNQQEKLAAEKLAAEKAELEKLEAEKLADEEAELEKLEAEKLADEEAKIKAEIEAEKLEAEKLAADEKAKAEKQLSKNKYEVAVTGFLAFGKMFRSDTKIDNKIYKDYLKLWLKEGKIRVKK